MAYSNTGLFRTNKVKSKGMKKGYRYAYQINNELVHVDIRKANILDLKKAVLEKGLLWGITDMEKAIMTANENEINVVELEGRYGLKMGE